MHFELFSGPYLFLICCNTLANQENFLIVFSMPIWGFFEYMSWLFLSCRYVLSNNKGFIEDIKEHVVIAFLFHIELR